jgi:UrcA family protein
VGGAGATLALAAVIVAFTSGSGRSAVPAAMPGHDADISLNSPAGARDIYARIERAAVSSCGTPVQSAADPCVQGAVAQAVRELNTPQLARVYVDTNGYALAQKFGIAGADVLANN